MNIFVFNKDPILAADDMCKSHMIKMPLETTQMLCTSINLKGIQTKYKSCHMNHPCTIWTRQSKTNFNWLIEHGKRQFENYTTYFGKVHASQEVFEQCEKYAYLFDDTGLTEFAQAMPDQYKNIDVEKAYRSYFIGEKQRLAVWKNKIPDWYK